MRNKANYFLTAISLLLLIPNYSNAQKKVWPKPIIEPDGTVFVPSFKLPPSEYMSVESRKTINRDISDEESNIEEIINSGGIPELRKAIIRDMEPQINIALKRFSVITKDTVIGGIQAIKVVPLKRKLTNLNKVIINLHSGGFLVGSHKSMGLIESIPVASLSGIEVIAIQYRQAPEFVFPAASIDVATVYSRLLKTYKSENIGIFGCSSGGLLTAQAIAWLQKGKLPIPGAVAILSASGDAKWAGDSWFWQKPLLGMSSPPSLDERFYYGKYDLNDSLMSPIKSIETLKKFPPTLIIAGIRSPEMSSAANTHRELIKAKVDARLHIWDGMGHMFFTNFDLPESNEVYEVVSRFFDEILAQKIP